VSGRPCRATNKILWCVRGFCLWHKATTIRRKQIVQKYHFWPPAFGDP